MKKVLSLFLAIIIACSCFACNMERDEDDETIAAVGEECSHKYSEEVIQSTCTTDGYTRYFCSLCEGEYIGNITYATGHNYTDWVVSIEPTCQAVGEMIHKCTICKEEETEKLALSAHNYVAISEADDKITYKCEVCERIVTKNKDEELYSDAEKTLFDCDINQSLNITFSGQENTLKNVLDIVPVSLENTAYEALIDYSVTANGTGRFIISPVTAFSEGGCYVVRLKSKDVSFTDFPEVERLIIKIKSDEKFELEINEDIKFIKALNDQNPGYYPYSVNVSNGSGLKYASVMKVDDLNVGDIVCFGEYSDMFEIIQNETIKNDYCFGKITQIQPAEVGFILTLSETSAKDIYTKADISYTTGIVLHEEELTDSEKENLQNMALTSVLQDDDFVTQLVVLNSAAEEYIESKGLKPVPVPLGSFGPKELGGFKFKVDYEFNNENVYEYEWKDKWKPFGKEFAFKKTENGTKIEITLTVSREFKAQTSAGSDAGSLEVTVVASFLCEPRINLEYKTENDVLIDDISEVSAVMISNNKFTFDFKVHAGIDYSLENKPYVFNRNTGTYHCSYCHVVETNEGSSDFQGLTAEKFASETKDYDDGNTAFCGICKPQTALKNDSLLINYNTGMVHINGCEYTGGSCESVQGLASMYEAKGYDLCSHCEPGEQQEKAFKDIVESKIKSGGFEKEVSAFKSGLKKLGAVEAGTAENDYSLIKQEIPVAGIFMLMIQVDLNLDFDLNATMQYTYTASNTTKAWVWYSNGFNPKCGKEQSDTVTTHTLEFIGTSKASIGLDFSIGVAIIAEDLASVKMTLGVGVYAKLNGMFHYDSNIASWYGGAYFEAGTYLGVSATATILWNAFEIPVVKTKYTPLFNLGYDEIWISFITPPTSTQTQGNVLILDAEDYLKVKTYNLVEMKTEEKTLSFSGADHYKVNVEFANGNKYFTGSNGTYGVADNINEDFIETVTLSVESTSSWNDYKAGQAVVFLEPYTFTVEHDDLTDSGTLSGKICKASDRITAIPDANIEVYKNGEFYKSAVSNSTGNYEISLPEGQYFVKISSDGYIDFKAYANVSANENTYMETFLLIEGSDDESGIASGKVVNSLTGVGTSEVTLVIKKDWNNTDEASEIVQTTITDSNGNYSVELPLGNYTVIASKEGYTSSSFNIIVQKGTTENQNGIITPLIAGDNYLITLRWEENPRDLDSHLAGTLSDGSWFHVYFSDKSQYDGDIEVCNLDYDDTNSYGPEHITLNTTNDAPYYYYIHRYAGSGTVSNSGAKITVEQGNVLIAEFNVPTNLGNEDYWNVFAIKNGELIVNNTFTSSPDLEYAN